MRYFRARYGGSPLHLLLILCSFALTAYAGVRLLGTNALAVAVWFVGAALVHDLVLLPLYTLLDRAVRRLLPAGAATSADRAADRAALINHVRVPGLVSLLLLLVWYPLVLRRVPGYAAATGLSPDVFLGHWLLVTAALFAASAVWYVVSLALRDRPGPQDGSHDGRRVTGDG
ncbi:hypothetical protein ACFRR7_17980 [Streptomyces sp. NPDC056909]|uniref:hypothetical protein n=1 Tax=unclassified Streptomyces TaxID=2593676 RepID=UPI00367955F5